MVGWAVQRGEFPRSSKRAHQNTHQQSKNPEKLPQRREKGVDLLDSCPWTFTHVPWHTGASTFSHPDPTVFPLLFITKSSYTFYLVISTQLPMLQKPKTRSLKSYFSLGLWVFNVMVLISHKLKIYTHIIFSYLPIF